MTVRDLAAVDRDLDALDPAGALASRGASRATKGLDLAEAERLLEELGGPQARVSTTRLRSAPPVDVEDALTLPPRRAEPPVEIPPIPPAPAPRAIDVGVDPDLSFDDLFDDVPDFEAASQPLTSLAPAPPVDEDDDRPTIQIDGDDLDSVEILVDD